MATVPTSSAPVARPERPEFWWASPAFKARYLADPRGTLANLGVTVPEHFPPQILDDVARVLMVVWVDGKLVARDTFHIDPLDEGLLFGKGLWESTRTVNGIPWLWDLHLDRLLKTAKLVQLEIAPERLPTAEVVQQYVRALTETDVVVRLNVSAGRPGQPGMVWMTLSLRPQPRGFVRLKSQRTSVLPGLPYLMWKTFQYANRLQINREAAQAGYDGALMLDEQDRIQEAAHANIFLRMPEGWVTPPVDGQGLLLPGTVRHYLLEHAPHPVQQAVVPLARLAEAREVFVTNSNVGIVPVTQIDQHDFPLVGEQTLDFLKLCPKA